MEYVLINHEMRELNMSAKLNKTHSNMWHTVTVGILYS